jgi:CheY-like chemotaxis protein
MNILIIEDDLMVRKALSHTLLEAGHTVSVATNGQEAIALIEKNRIIDVVISDVMMPVLTGPSFILHLKNYFPKKMPHVIIISGDKVGEDYLQKIEIPYDHFLSKPIKTRELLKVIENFSHTEASQ